MSKKYVHCTFQSQIAATENQHRKNNLIYSNLFANKQQDNKNFSRTEQFKMQKPTMNQLMLGVLLTTFSCLDVTAFSVQSSVSTRKCHLIKMKDQSSFITDETRNQKDEFKHLTNILRNCANKRSVDAKTVISTLEEMETLRDRGNSFFTKELVDGKFELIFSSSVANLPFIGSIFNGYMPNKEIITFDFEQGQMSLLVEILPFLPTINIYGDSLKLKDGVAIEYTIRGKSKKQNSPKSSRWDLLYADDEIVAAKSSVTGLNVIRRLS